jgi:hypothetical protein
VEDARVSTQGLYQAMLDWAGCEAAQLVGDAPVLAEYEGAWHHAGSLRRTRAAADNGRLKATVWVIYKQAWKYGRDATGAETLYDLDADPGETADASADAPQASLRRQLAQALEHQQPCLLEERGVPAERDPMVEHELKALGYL